MREKDHLRAYHLDLVIGSYYGHEPKRGVIQLSGWPNRTAVQSIGEIHGADGGFGNCFLCPPKIVPCVPRAYYYAGEETAAAPQSNVNFHRRHVFHYSGVTVPSDRVFDVFCVGAMIDRLNRSAVGFCWLRV